MHSYRHLIPWFPLSVFTFYTVVVVLSHLGLIPSFWDIIDQLRILYETYGLPALAISAILESTAYVGLYFPGSAVIALAVVLSDGQLSTFVTISIVVALSINLGCTVSYYLGLKRHSLPHFTNMQLTVNPEHSSDAYWFIANGWHPQMIGLWFFKRGLDNKKSSGYLTATAPMLFCWGMMYCYLIFTLRQLAESESLWPIYVILIVWMAGEVLYRYRNQ